MSKELTKLLADLAVLNYCILNTGSCAIPVDFECKLEEKVQVIEDELRINSEFQILLSEGLASLKKEYESQ